MPTQLHECLACERRFDISVSITSGVSEQYQSQYCCKDCEANFERFLATEIEAAKQHGLITNDGAPVLSPPKQQQANLKHFVDSIRLKV